MNMFWLLAVKPYRINGYLIEKEEEISYAKPAVGVD